MKTKILLGFSILFAFGTALGQGTAFTYQGRLNDGGNPAHGAYDFRFKLFQDPDGNKLIIHKLKPENRKEYANDHK